MECKKRGKDMRNERINQKLSAVLTGLLTLVLVLSLGLFANVFAIVSHAESQAKVTASSAKIRKEANTTSEVLGSVAKDTKISIISQVNGSDGYVWYQTYANATTTGYVRSDLVQITDGSTPGTGTATETAGSVSDAGVTKVNPVSATVSGGSSVRIRNQASTSGKIVTTASNGLALTVTGKIAGSDGKDWYLVSYSANGSEVSGYIRSDFVTLSGDLSPLTDAPSQPVDTPAETPEEKPQDTTPAAPAQEYGVQEDGGVWYLTLPKKGEKYDIQELFDKVKNNAEAYTKISKKAKTEKAIIIVLVIILLALVAAVVYLFMKVKEMSDNAYYRQVESETLRRRGTQQGQKQVQQKQAQAQGQKPAQKTGEPKKVMQTVGEDKPQGQRPAQAQGQRPQGARPAQPQGARPAQAQGQRPQGARPAQPQGQRPAQAQGQRPQGARPAQPQGQRPAQAQGQRPQGARPAQPQGQRPAQPTQTKPPVKNILADDDEFEFDFLNELDKE